MLSRIRDWLASRVRRQASAPRAFDDDSIVSLDAEDLAELGIKNAYESIVQKIPEFFPTPAPIEELIDEEGGNYSVKCLGQVFEISRGDSPATEGDSWGRATHALFQVLNRQLADQSVTFYALNGGNDLCGVFLTPVQLEAARAILKRKEDWPYQPTEEPPWFGMPRSDR